MGFYEDVKQSKQKQRGPKCSVGMLLHTGDPEYVEGLLQALADETLEHVQISSVLREDGHDILQGTVRRHRRGLCRCPAS